MMATSKGTVDGVTISHRFPLANVIPPHLLPVSCTDRIPRRGRVSSRPPHRSRPRLLVPASGGGAEHLDHDMARSPHHTLHQERFRCSSTAPSSPVGRRCRGALPGGETLLAMAAAGYAAFTNGARPGALPFLCNARLQLAPPSAPLLGSHWTKRRRPRRLFRRRRTACAAPGGLLLLLPLSAKRSAAALVAGRPEIRRRLAGPRPAAPRSAGGNRPRGRRRRGCH